MQFSVVPKIGIPVYIKRYAGNRVTQCSYVVDCGNTVNLHFRRALAVTLLLMPLGKAETQLSPPLALAKIVRLPFFYKDGFGIK